LKGFPFCIILSKEIKKGRCVMTEQGNLPTQRVNISTQKMLGGIGYILLLLFIMPGTLATLLGIVGGCSVVHQHVPAEQYTKKAEYF
jgi:branched-subunit amino acid permease